MKLKRCEVARVRRILSLVCGVTAATLTACGDSPGSPTEPPPPPPVATDVPQACFTTVEDLDRFIVTAGQSVGLDASCTTGDLSNVSFAWDLGDGRTATGRTVDVTYDDPGDYRVRLSAFNEAGTSTTAQNLRVNPRPVACFTMSQPFEEGTPPCTIRVDATCSTGSIETYTWFFEGGREPPLSLPDTTMTTTEPVVDYSWAEGQACQAFRPFERDVRLTIADESGVTDDDEDVAVFSSPVLKRARER